MFPNSGNLDFNLVNITEFDNWFNEIRVAIAKKYYVDWNKNVKILYTYDSEKVVHVQPLLVMSARRTKQGRIWWVSGGLEGASGKSRVAVK